MTEEQGLNLLQEGLLLDEMISYQDKSVVSRTLINRAEGTLTLFAFDRGESLSEHTAPFDALVYIFDGAAAVTVSGKTYNLGKGEVLMMPAHEPHALKAAERFKMMLVMVKG